MIRTFGLTRDQVMHDYDVTRVNTWLKTVDDGRLITAVAQGAFQLTLVYSFTERPAKPVEKTDTL